MQNLAKQMLIVLAVSLLPLAAVKADQRLEKAKQEAAAVKEQIRSNPDAAKAMAGQSFDGSVKADKSETPVPGNDHASKPQLTKPAATAGAGDAFVYMPLDMSGAQQVYAITGYAQKNQAPVPGRAYGIVVDAAAIGCLGGWQLGGPLGCGLGAAAMALAGYAVSDYLDHPPQVKENSESADNSDKSGHLSNFIYDGP